MSTGEPRRGVKSDLKHSMQDALGGAVKGSGSPASCSDPVNCLLPMSILVELRNAAIIVQAVPVLSNNIVWVCFEHILTDKLSTISPYKVKPAAKGKSTLSGCEHKPHNNETSAGVTQQLNEPVLLIAAFLIATMFCNKMQCIVYQLFQHHF